MASLKVLTTNFVKIDKFIGKVLKFAYMKITPQSGDEIIVEIFERVYWFDKIMR